MKAALRERFNVTQLGDGPVTLLFVHGLGCHQGMWRQVAPHFAASHRVILMDLMGCGRSDWSAWEPARYATLDGHAEDVVRVAEELSGGHTVLVGHSVAAMIALLADLKAPHAFDAHAMLAPSPCYYNLPDYEGGFDADAIAGILQLIDTDISAFARTMAPLIMGTQNPAEMASEMESAFCAAHPAAFRQFAHATFEGDWRHCLPELVKPVLVMQCTDDVIAPMGIGRYMAKHLPDCRLEVLPTRGHVPQLAEPQRCIAVLEKFLAGLGLGG
jgi:sigma-B regulation protein RsbQ